MKTIILLNLCLLASYAVFAQKMPEDYFEEAAEYYEQKQIDKALEANLFIVKNHPRNELYPRALYNTGILYAQLKRHDEAIIAFKTMLKSNANDKEDSGNRDIMGEPYANYKHEASQILSQLYENKKDYDSALYYFSLADTVYPYEHFCGNALAAQRIYTVVKYSSLYQNLNQPKKAIQVLLPYIFEDGIADNSEVIAELKTLFTNQKNSRKRFDQAPVIAELNSLFANPKNIKKDFDQSLEAIYTKEIRRNEHTYTSEYLKFFEVEIELSFYDVDKKTTLVEHIKKSTFYKMLEEL